MRTCHKSNVTQNSSLKRKKIKFEGITYMPIGKLSVRNKMKYSYDK